MMASFPKGHMASFPKGHMASFPEGHMAPRRTGAMSCADGMPFAMHTLARRAPAMAYWCAPSEQARVATGRQLSVARKGPLAARGRTAPAATQVDGAHARLALCKAAREGEPAVVACMATSAQGLGLTPASPAPGLGLTPAHICTGTWAHPGRPHLHRDLGSPRPHLHRDERGSPASVPQNRNSRGPSAGKLQAPTKGLRLSERDVDGDFGNFERKLRSRWIREVFTGRAGRSMPVEPPTHQPARPPQCKCGCRKPSPGADVGGVSPRKQGLLLMRNGPDEKGRAA
jgi:hypothetical protein